MRGKQITEQEETKIQEMVHLKASPSEIARELQRSPSTVTAFLRRKDIPYERQRNGVGRPRKSEQQSHAQIPSVKEALDVLQKLVTSYQDMRRQKEQLEAQLQGIASKEFWEINQELKSR